MSRSLRIRFVRAHPRSRGENKFDPGSQWSERGSSPLTRGKQDGSTSGAYMPGLIPAHAGKTLAFSAPTRARPAHPRSRGENRGT